MPGKTGTSNKGQGKTGFVKIFSSSLVTRPSSQAGFAGLDDDQFGAQGAGFLEGFKDGNQIAGGGTDFVDCADDFIQ